MCIRDRAKTAVNEIFDGKFGKADQVLIEEFLEGDEMSFLLFQMELVIKLLIQLKTIKELVKVILVRIREEWGLIHLQT